MLPLTILILLCIAFLIASIITIENERPGWTFILAIIFMVALHVFKITDIPSLLTNWQMLFCVFLAYLSIGVGWSMFKWFLYTHEWKNFNVEAIKKARIEFLTRLKIDGDTIPNEHLSAWEKWRKQSISTGWESPYEILYYPSSIAAKFDTNEIAVQNNWNKILTWGLYWPVSALWTIIDNPIKKLLKFLIINVFVGIYEFFTNKAKNEVEKELNK